MEKRCRAAADSPGLVGEKHYRFEDPARNMKGHATQSILSCRCLKHSCGHSIVTRIRKLNGKDGFVCLYPKYNDKWIDCHSEMIRLKDGDRIDPNIEAPTDKVPIGASGYWTGAGSRESRAQEKIEEEYFDTLESVSFGRILDEYEGLEEKTSMFFNSSHQQQMENKTFVKDDDQDTCSKLYYYAVQKGILNAAQQDLVSIATEESSFLTPRPEDISVTDAVLAIGAAFAGVFTAYRLMDSIRNIIRKQRKNMHRHGNDQSKLASNKRKIKWLPIWARLFALTFLVGPAELAALFFAFATHNNALNWISFFTWMDLAVALPADVAQCKPYVKCSAAGGMYIATLLLGTVGHESATRGRWISLLVMMVVILLCFVGIVFESLRLITKFWLEVKREGLGENKKESV
ncbi:hypothetical protein FGB62_260g07 [Gracilaria domingensis]|nr:hypothetical protein FGB62_260g07 [Gracilaria domingensis]